MTPIELTFLTVATGAFVVFMVTLGYVSWWSDQAPGGKR